MARHTVSDTEVLAQVPRARGRARHGTPRALQVSFDRKPRTFRIVLSNGAALSVPAGLIPSVASASDQASADVCVGPAGLAIRWNRLDLDLSVSHLVTLAFGSGLLLRAAGAAGGSSRSSAKAAAARKNGMKGGRPRRGAGV